MIEEWKRQRHDALIEKERWLRVKQPGHRPDETDAVATPFELDDANAYHLFLSHTWKQGEDQMRTVKERLLQMVPKLRVFLDKDDLEGGNGADGVDKSAFVLCFCTRKYLASKPCAREILRAYYKRKP